MCVCVCELMHFSPFAVSFSSAQRSKQFCERETYFMIIFMRKFYCIQRDLRLNQCSFAIQQQQLLIIIYAHNSTLTHKTYKILQRIKKKHNESVKKLQAERENEKLMLMMMTPLHASCTQKCVRILLSTRNWHRSSSLYS